MIKSTTVSVLHPTNEQHDEIFTWMHKNGTWGKDWDWNLRYQPGTTERQILDFIFYTDTCNALQFKLLFA